jgi:hypothetical protein
VVTIDYFLKIIHDISDISELQAQIVATTFTQQHFLFSIHPKNVAFSIYYKGTSK